MNIIDIKEHNCLMKHGQTEGLDSYFWTDGYDVENTSVECGLMPLMKVK